jgi:hypothetical protein
MWLRRLAADLRQDAAATPEAVSEGTPWRAEARRTVRSSAAQIIRVYLRSFARDAALRGTRVACPSACASGRILRIHHLRTSCFVWLPGWIRAGVRGG